MQAPFVMETPPQYLMAKRPVEQQLDMRNLLTSLAGAYTAPQTSYFGLTPENVQASAGQQLQRMGEMGQMIQQAQKMGVGQEQQQFSDALNAHKMYLADRDQRMQEALNGLRMQQMKQSMAQSAASHGVAMRNAALANSLNDLKFSVPDGKGGTMELTGGQLKALGGNPLKMLMSGGSGRAPSVAQQKYDASIEGFARNLDPEDARAFAAGFPAAQRNYNTAMKAQQAAWAKTAEGQYGQPMPQTWKDQVMQQAFGPLLTGSKNRARAESYLNSLYGGGGGGGEASALPASGTPSASASAPSLFVNDYQPALSASALEDAMADLDYGQSGGIAPVVGAAPAPSQQDPQKLALAEAFLRNMNALAQSKLVEEQRRKEEEEAKNRWSF